MSIREELVKAAEKLKANPTVAKGIELYDAQVKMLHDGALRSHYCANPSSVCSSKQRDGSARHGHAQQGQGRNSCHH